MVWNGSSQSTAAEIARMQAHADKMWGRGSAACAKPQEITAIEEASRRFWETPK
jgi:hypothetical protein